MPAKIDLTGSKFNNLTILEYVTSSSKTRKCVCLCGCGNTIIASAASVKFGNTKSCGCLKKKVLQDRNTKHSMRNTPEYEAWRGAKKRVDGKDREKYVLHGITMDADFYSDFKKFYDYIGPRPSDQHSLGRIDNFKGYTRGNIRWEITDEQARNHSKQINNKTGVVGVFKITRKDKYTSYVAKCTVADLDFKKEFSCNKYGEELAFFLACEQRDKWVIVNELCFGIKYADTHGISKEEYEEG